jgi:hypothetical protein
MSRAWRSGTRTPAKARACGSVALRRAGRAAPRTGLRLMDEIVLIAGIVQEQLHAT